MRITLEMQHEKKPTRPRWFLLLLIQKSADSFD
jgi:hypothetical protein